ncbi:Lipid A export ATP-binding/permease protein MsbA [Candidatus Promineifilum breve]|uniref:Lipid A export ATP-binding/permease protein MsbA n=1 Tax=Candidatus Promineifilum breve TaxID=1806508 RepID=A0A170PI17_9CHLR|nr:ABC transporter ATP-binding protein [Candidatus Promineifilum breve]CUS04593.2 Lipid A export ATP-binding/permease protein MsbA [Candidatus Promineifilum breve]
MRFRRIARRQAAKPDDANPPITRGGLSVFRRLLGYVRPYWRWMTVAVVALIISSLLGLVLPLVVRNLVDFAFVNDDVADLNRVTLGLLAVFIFQSLFTFIQQMALANAGERAVADIRIDVFTHLQELPLSFYAERRTGELVSRVTNDVALLQQSMTWNLVILLRQIITIIGAAALLFWLDWRLTLLILLVVPVITLTMVWLGGRIRDASVAVQDSLAEIANSAEETTRGVRIVKSFAREPYEIGRFTTRVMDLYHAAMRRARINAMLAPLIGLIASITITGILYYGGSQVIAGNLSPGDLIAYLIYTVMVASPIAIMADLYGQFQAAIGASQRLFELLDRPSEIVEQPDARPLPLVAGEVVFQDVGFHYTTAIDVLDDVSFRARPGQLIALVGPSGAGKSTLVNLIPRFYDPVGGRITIDGNDVRAVTLKSLREQIGIVPQETILFSGSVYDNIRYGRLEATRAEIEAAAMAANAHTFIVEDLEHGYETAVGEHGVKLSGGQRQRIAIARAILKDPRILILDEATSSLDSESESLVQDALERLMRGRTSFVIAHRLSTVLNADWILVMNKGRIVEQGTHATLLLNPDGLYARLYNRQFAIA